MQNTNWCGYCAKCEEFKYDDYGQWYIAGEFTDNPEVKICRGCRD